VENGDDGAQGWSIGVETVGPCAITVATTVATAGATVKNGGFRDAGFERTELTTGERNAGVVSAVALSFTFPITLPPELSPHEILGLELEGQVPTDGESCSDCTIRYREGLVGAGQPVSLVVAFDETTFVPLTRALTVPLCRVPCFPSAPVPGFDPFGVGDEVVGSARPLRGLVEVCSFSSGYGSADDGSVDSLLTLARDSVTQLKMTAQVVEVVGQAGVEIRSFRGTANDPGAPVLSIFAEGTANGDARLVSAVRLSRGSELSSENTEAVPIELPVRVGVERVGHTMTTFFLRDGQRVDHLTVDVSDTGLDVPYCRAGVAHGSPPRADGVSDTAGARFADLQLVSEPAVHPPRLGRSVVNSFGSLTRATIVEIHGTRLENAEEVVVAGVRTEIIEREPNRLAVLVPPTTEPLRGDILVRTPGGTTRLPNSFFSYGGEFIRCDWDGNRLLDISDAIGIVGHLFLGEQPSKCPATGDCNSDARIDLSDVLKAVNYLFLGAAPPEAPYPDPGYGPDGESCVELPVITAISNQQIGPNEEFTIEGSGFSEIPERNIVLLGDAQLKVVDASPTQLTVKSGMILTTRTVPLAILTEFDLGTLLRPPCPEPVCLPTLIGPVVLAPELLVDLVASDIQVAATTDSDRGPGDGITLELDRNQFDPTRTYTVTGNVLAPLVAGVSPGGRITSFQHTFSRSDLSFEKGVVELARALDRELAAGGPMTELIVVPRPEEGVVRVMPSALAIASATDFLIDGVISMYPTIGSCGPTDLHPVDDEREFGWCRLEQIVEVQACSGRPAFEHYIPVSFVFTESGDLSGVPDPDDRSPSMKSVLYNLAAYCHVRKHDLWNECELEELVDGGSTEIPPFPVDAWVMKTAWRSSLPAGADPNDYYSYVYSGDGVRYYLTALHHTTKDQGDWFWLDAYPPEQTSGVGGCGGTNVDATATIQASEFAEYFLCTNVTTLQPLATTGIDGVGPTATENSAICGNFEFTPECPDSLDGGGGSETCLSCHERATKSLTSGSIEIDFLYSMRAAFNPNAPTPCSSTTGTVDFTTQIQTVFDANCSCHTGGSVSGGLDLATGSSHANIVNVPADDVPGMDLIEPGSPSDSYLWHKLQGTHLGVGGAGSAMPFGSFPLGITSLDTIEQWINEGASP